MPPYAQVIAVDRKAMRAIKGMMDMRLHNAAEGPRRKRSGTETPEVPTYRDFPALAVQYTDASEHGNVRPQKASERHALPPSFARWGCSTDTRTSRTVDNALPHASGEDRSTVSKSERHERARVDGRSVV